MPSAPSFLSSSLRGLVLEKLYRPHGRPRHLYTIPVKDSNLFKIAELVFSFYLKLHNFKEVEVFY